MITLFKRLYHNSLVRRFVRGLAAVVVGFAATSAIAFVANPPAGLDPLLVAMIAAIALSADKWARSHGDG